MNVHYCERGKFLRGAIACVHVFLKEVVVLPAKVLRWDALKLRGHSFEPFSVNVVAIWAFILVECICQSGTLGIWWMMQLSRIHLSVQPCWWSSLAGGLPLFFVVFFDSLLKRGLQILLVFDINPFPCGTKIAVCRVAFKQMVRDQSIC